MSNNEGKERLTHEMDHEPNERFLDDTDRSLLNLLQWEFPLSPTPFADLASKVGISEEDAIARTQKMCDLGIIRQLSAIFDTRRLGYKSSLVAVRAPEDKIDEVAAVFSAHPGVSHNYRRNHHFNIWFTLAVPPSKDFDSELAALCEQAGAESWRKLPTLNLYKIGVRLDMVADETTLQREEIKRKPGVRKNAADLTDRDKEFIRELQKHLPIVARPFDQNAANLGITVEELLKYAEEMVEAGYMRRFAAILRHQEAGFTANGMVVFKIPEDRVDEAGKILASFPQVSHCYRRPLYPDWQYNLFAMVHGRAVENCEKIAEDIQAALGENYEYTILFSTKEYKKTRVEYFVEV